MATILTTVPLRNVTFPTKKKMKIGNYFSKFAVEHPSNTSIYLYIHVYTQIACILAASLIFSGYYLVMTSLSCQICGKTPAKLTES